MRKLLLLVALVSGCDRIAPAGGAGAPALRPSDGGSAVAVYFSQVWDKPAANRENPRSIARACAEYVNQAMRTLDVCGFEIDNAVIVEAIVAAKRRGVKVRVITDPGYVKESGPVAFQAEGIPVIWKTRTGGLTHQKFLVIDGMTVWTGSFNFTENCAYKNNNVGAAFLDANLAENYTTWFDWFWSDGRSSRSARGRSTPHPFVQLSDGTRVENRFTSFDKLDEVVMRHVKNARQSVKFMAFAFTHDGIGDAMVQVAKRGVKVTGVFESRMVEPDDKGTVNSEYAKLSRTANVEVYRDGNPFLVHHKTIIIDDRLVIVGSFNFSRNATDKNDENLVVIFNPAVAQECDREFQRVLAQAKSPVKPLAGRSGSAARQ